MLLALAALAAADNKKGARSVNSSLYHSLKEPEKKIITECSSGESVSNLSLLFDLTNVFFSSKNKLFIPCARFKSTQIVSFTVGSLSSFS